MIKRLRIVLSMIFIFLFSCKENNKSEKEEVIPDTNGSISIPNKTNNNGEIKGLHIGCGYNYNLTTNELKIYYPQQREIEAIKNIISYSGLPLNFEIYSADIQNAVATIIDNKRYIIYDPKLLNFTDTYSNSYWSSISILAHEIGHHLSGHTLKNNINNHDVELQADKFSGFILYKMGASQEQATNAMRLIGSDTDSESHPNKKRRIQAIIDGWYEASGQRYSSAVPPPPADDKNFAGEAGYLKIEFTKEELISESALNNESYGGVINSYNFPLQEGIIIDVEKTDPTDGARAELFSEPRSEFNMILTIQLTKTVIDPFNNTAKEGKRYQFHLIDYYNMNSADRSWLEAILVAGRKIQFKSFYFGYGAEDIFYIKKLER